MSDAKLNEEQIHGLLVMLKSGYPLSANNRRLVLALLDEHAEQKQRIEELERQLAEFDALRARVTHLDTLLDNAVWATEFVTQVTVKRRSYIEARVFADDMVQHAREFRAPPDMRHDRQRQEARDGQE